MAASFCQHYTTWLLFCALIACVWKTDLTRIINNNNNSHVQWIYAHIGREAVTLRWSFDWEYFMRWVLIRPLFSTVECITVFFMTFFFFFVSFSLSARIVAKFTNSRPVMCGTYLIFNTYLKTCVHHFICLLDIWHLRPTSITVCRAFPFYPIQIQSEHNCT